MKTLLFAPLFIDGPERLERNKQWLTHLKTISKYLNYDELYFVDNGSDPKLLEEFKNHQFNTGIRTYIDEHKVRLTRNTEHGYSYWYYAFGNAVRYAKKHGYDRIVHIDTDVYLLNKHICYWVNCTKSGWQCFWSEMHKYPESTFQIIGKDQFNNAEEFFTRDFLSFYPNKLAEHEIPWTNVIKEFNIDRWGEKNIQQTPDMDAYCQKPNHIILKFNE